MKRSVLSETLAGPGHTFVLHACRHQASVFWHIFMVLIQNEAWAVPSSRYL